VTQAVDIYRNLCLPGFVKIRRLVLEISRQKAFLCLRQSWLANGIMLYFYGR